MNGGKFWVRVTYIAAVLMDAIRKVVGKNSFIGILGTRWVK